MSELTIEELNEWAKRPACTHPPSGKLAKYALKQRAENKRLRELLSKSVAAVDARNPREMKRVADLALRALAEIGGDHEF